MKIFVLPLLSLFLLAGCQQDAATDPATTIETAEDRTAREDRENAERLSQVAPPPPVCFYLNEAEVLTIFGSDTQIPMPGHRATTSYNSCQYEIDGPGRAWTGTLVVEMPENSSDIQNIRDEVAGAKGADKVSVAGAPARIMNDGRVISVDGKQVFRVKFVAIGRGGVDGPFDVEARLKLIQELALAVLTT